METIETSISLQQSLFEEAEVIAHEMNISRSQLLEIAVAEFVHRYHVRQSLSLEKLNEAYTDSPDPDDERLLAGMRRLHRQVLEQDD
jgi:hypothetical protein